MKRNGTSNREEVLASQLKKLSINQVDKREMLQVTLERIDLRNNKADTEAQYLTQATDDVTHDTLRNKTIESSSMVSRLKLYVPLATIAILMVLTSGVLMHRQTSPVNDNTPSLVANGTVENMTAALTEDLTKESIIDQELITEGQTAMQGIVAATQQVGDISNDTSF